MSKQIKLRLFGSFLVVSLLAGLCLTGATRAQQPSPVQAANTKSATAIEATAEVLQETSEIRALPILRPVRSGLQSRSEIERMIISKLDENSSPEEMHASELTLKKLGLVPDDFKMRPFVISLLTEQVAGYYDAKAQKFFLADWIDIEGQRPVMAHELTHALQDQHFNLRRFEKWPKGDSDAELAAHALIEGDATLAMTHYILRNPTRALGFLKSMEGNRGTSEQFDRAPRALRESLLFPYEQGTEWATRLYQRGGWERVSKAFSDLPQSTEQILHIEKYLEREAPVKITLPDLRPLLGAGWRLLDSDVNGEFGYYLILDEYLNAKSESRAAAAGWGGDRYALYENTRTKETLIVQVVVWDTEEDATEFFDNYSRRTERRYKNASDLALSVAAPAIARAWRTGEGNVALQQRGKRVVIVEGLPGKLNLKAVIARVS